MTEARGMQINRDNLNKLITHLKRLRDAGKQHKFNMWDYLWHPGIDSGASMDNIGELRASLPDGTVIDAFECGTVACIAGHCALIGGAAETDFVHVFAREWLGLTPGEAHDLFLGHWGRRATREGRCRVGLDEVTLDEAIAHLESL